MEERHPVVAEKSWKDSLSASLLQYYDYSDDYSDAFILIGEEKIYCHRLILSLNSQILEDCDSQVWAPAEDRAKTSQNSSNYYQIELLPDFDDHPDIVRQIVRSFYCGEITLTEENIKVVYKFAKWYRVRWLHCYAQLMFNEILGAENFVNMFIFAQKFGTTDNKLIESCLNRLDSHLLINLIERETGSIFELDYYCLKSITSNNRSLISPMETFSLISNWAEYDLESRRCHIEILLFDVKYHRIAKMDLLDQVYPWILNVKGMEDSIRTSLMRTITKRIREADIRENFLKSGDVGIEITEMRVDKYLSDIMQLMESKATDGDYSIGMAKTLSSQELLCVIKARYPKAKPIVKQCIIEYINENNMVNQETVTQLMKLYETNKDADMRYLLQKFLNGGIPRLAPTYVEWAALPYDIARDFLKEVSLGEREFIRVECIMKWADGNILRKDQITKLLTELVCYERIPEEYKKLVLKPYLKKKVLPEQMIELICGVHEADCIDHTEETLLRCTVKRISREFYMMQDTEQKLEDCNMRLRLCLNNSDRPLQLAPNNLEESDYMDYYTLDYYANFGRYDFLLFDKKKPLESYPVHSDNSPNLQGLRELFANYKNLHVMVIWEPDSSQIQSTVPPIPPR